MPAERGLFAGIPRWLSALYGMALAAILCLLTFGQGTYSQYIGNDALLGNLPLTGLGLLLTAAGLMLFRRFGKSGGIETPAFSARGTWLLCGLYLGLFALQCLVARSIWFYVGFDPGTVRLNAAALATGAPIDGDYFRLCPNNAPLTVLLALPYWIGYRLGLAEPYVLDVYFSVLSVNLSCFFAMSCLCLFTGRKGIRLFFFALSTVFVLFSPYIVMPYTDSFAILFPILALRILLSGWKTPLRYGGASLVCFFGAAIKPTALIFLIAALILGACAWLRTLSVDSAPAWKRGLAVLLAVALGCLPGVGYQRWATALLAGSAKPEEMLDTAHYLMIGLDDQYWGGHSVEDLAYSQSFPTLKERNAANLAKAWAQVRQRGLSGNLHFFSVKAYKAYADGTFAFNGSALMDAVPKRTDGLARFLRSVFHRARPLNKLYCTLMQGLWLLILALCAAAALLCRRRREVQLIALSLLGLTAYQLLFEVWPRYLFLYAPFFLLLAALGLETIAQTARSRRSKGA